MPEVSLSHPLHSAPSPLVRALPDYERHFSHNLLTARAYWDVAQQRMQRCAKAGQHELNGR